MKCLKPVSIKAFISILKNCTLRKSFTFDLRYPQRAIYLTCLKAIEEHEDEITHVQPRPNVDKGCRKLQMFGRFDHCLETCLAELGISENGFAHETEIDRSTL